MGVDRKGVSLLIPHRYFVKTLASVPALEAARILNAWREALSSIPNLTFNPGLAMAGTDLVHDDGNTRGTVFGKNNVIAQSAIVTGGHARHQPRANSVCRILDA